MDSSDQTNSEVNLIDTSLSMYSESLNSSSQISQRLTEKSEISFFCRYLSKKAGVVILNLKDAVEFIDEYIPNTDLNKTVDIHITDEQYKKALDRIIELEEQNKKIAFENKEIECLNIDYKSEITRLNSELLSLKRELPTIKKDSEKNLELEKNISALSELTNQYVDEISKLNVQRTKLLSIIKRLNSIIQIYDDKIKEFEKKSISDAKTVHIIDDNYKERLISLLNDMLKYLTKLFPQRADIIREIIESYKTSDVKFEELYDVMKTEIETKKELIARQQDDTHEKDDQIKKLKIQCRRILSFLEEEVNFLHCSLNSQKLESLLYNENDREVKLSQNIKDELTRKIYKMSKFIEENYFNLNDVKSLNLINIDEYNSTRVPEEYVERTNIFNILEPNTYSSKLDNFVSRMDDEVSSEMLRELYCLFAAQILVNNIMHNHIIELTHDKMKYQSKAFNVENIENTLKSENRDLNDKLLKLEQLITGQSGFDALYNIEYNVTCAFTALNEKPQLLNQVKELNENLENLRNEMVNISKDFHDQLSKKEETFVSQIELLKSQISVKQQLIEELQLSNSSQNAEISTLKESIENEASKYSSKKDKISYLKREIELYKETFKEQESKMQKILDLSQTYIKENEALRDDGRKKDDNIINLREKIDELNEISREKNNKIEELSKSLSTLKLERDRVVEDLNTERREKEDLLKSNEIFKQNTLENQKQCQKIVEDTKTTYENRMKLEMDNQKELIRAACARLQLNDHNFFDNIVEYIEKLKDTLEKLKYENENLGSTNKSLKSEIKTSKDKVNTLITEKKGLEKDIKKFVQLINNMKTRLNEQVNLASSGAQWLIWAKRVLESNNVSCKSEEPSDIRLSLEVTLYKNMTSKYLIEKIDALRQQKLVLMKFGHLIQNINNTQQRSLNIRSVIRIVSFVYRLNQSLFYK